MASSLVSPNESSREEPIRTLLLLLLGVLVAQVVVGAATWCILPSMDARGQFGEMFGVANTLFSGSAFAGLVYALLLQRKDLALQREELKLTREELHSQSLSSAAQAKIQLKAARINGLGALLQANAHLMIELRGRGGGHEALLRTEQLQTQLDALLRENDA